MTEGSPAALMRARVRELQDYERAADSILGDIDLNDGASVTAWLRAGLHALARTIATQVRMVETQRITREYNGSPERIVVRVPVAEIGDGRYRYRSMTLADCGKRDLLFCIAELDKQIRFDMARMHSYQTLLRALDRHGVERVGDLPRNVVSAAFDDNEGGSEVAA